MEETRVSKYKDYRNQLIREGAPTLTNSRISEQDSSFSDTLNTQTLPINEVYDNLRESEEEQAELVALEKKKMILKYGFWGLTLLLVTVAIVIFAIFAFRSN